MEAKLTPEKSVIIGKTAVISDLHIGIEEVLRKSGVAFPRVQIKEIKVQLNTILPKVEKLIIAGDMKHEFSESLPYEWKEVEEIVSLILNSGVELVVVRGNHDNYLKPILRKMGVELVDSVDVKGWTIIHGHKECDAKKIVMGHEHPSIKIRVRGCIYNFPCFLHYNKNSRVVVLPAFSPLLPGSDVLSSDFISPILKKLNKNLIEIYAVYEDVLYLGKIENLANV